MYYIVSLRLLASSRNSSKGSNLGIFFDLVGKMVVVTDQKSNPADVVLVVEATANLSAYIDVLKKCYIIPSLE